MAEIVEPDAGSPAFPRWRWNASESFGVDWVPFSFMKTGRYRRTPVPTQGALTNDAEAFAETFENVAFMGQESLNIVNTICVNGASVGTVDPDDCAL